MPSKTLITITMFLSCTLLTSCLRVFHFTVSDEEYRSVPNDPVNTFRVVDGDTLQVSAFILGARSSSVGKPINIWFILKNTFFDSLTYNLNQLSVSYSDSTYFPDTVRIGGKVAGLGKKLTRNDSYTTERGDNASVQFHVANNYFYDAKEFKLFIGSFTHSDGRDSLFIDTIHFMAK